MLFAVQIYYEAEGPLVPPATKRQQQGQSNIHIIVESVSVADTKALGEWQEQQEQRVGQTFVLCGGV
jgi:hypothetical protein